MLGITLHALIALATMIGFDIESAMNVPPGMMPRGAAAGKSGDDKKSEFPPFNEVTKDMMVREGFFTLYQDEKKDRLLARIPKDKLGKYFLGATSITRGANMFTGWQWVDAPMYWDRHGKQLILMLAEPRYVKGKGSAVEDVIARTYMDSILRAVPIVTEADGDPVIDLADLLKADIVQIGEIFRGRVDRSLSRFDAVKNFEKNTEISVNLAVRSQPQGPPGRGMPQPGALVEARVVTVHYSFSFLPDPAKDDYQPREADNRVGYFITVVKDWTADHGAKTIFKRYINRWRLRKAEPDKDVSDVLPEDQIVFYIEKTVPVKFRPYVREGILNWNRAFEKAGLRNAIVVRQQTDQNEYKDLDPEDVRYNFFRWIVSGVPYAMGPSRANPFTGQILDADIVFDDSMVRYLLQEFDVSAPKAAFGLTDARLDEFLAHHDAWRFPLEKIEPFSRGPSALEQLRVAAERQPWGRRPASRFCELGVGAARQLAIASYTATAVGKRDLPEEFIGQVIKEISAHEVGHTLGLRHNFKASSWLPFEEIKKCCPEKGGATSASVMDYNPSWFAPAVEKQGCFVTNTIGPYDFWAIEYGYRPFGGGKAAMRGGPPGRGREPSSDPTAMTGAEASSRKPAGTDGAGESEVKKENSESAALDGKTPEGKKDSAPKSEAEMLKAIASRCNEPGHAYGTDEDTFFGAPDPTTNRFDNGADPLEWARDRTAALERLWKDGLDWAVKDGESWNAARRAFDMMLGEYGFVVFTSARSVGGQYVERSHKGDPGAKSPIQPVSAAKQREAMKFLADHVWSASAFQFSSSLLNHLAPGRWWHWDSDAIDFPVEFDLHERVRTIQWLALFQTMNPFTLNRLYDSQPLVPESEDAVTVPEVLNGVASAVWTELERRPDRNFSDRDPFITSFRRSLQRDHLQMLVSMVVSRGRTGLYPDIHSVARLSLKNLGDGIEKTLADHRSRLDDFSKAHLSDSRRKIARALEAEFRADVLPSSEGRGMMFGRE
jgi:hypothetical protein